MLGLLCYLKFWYDANFNSSINLAFILHCDVFQDQGHLTSMENLPGKLRKLHKSAKESSELMCLKLVAIDGICHISFVLISTKVASLFYLNTKHINFLLWCICRYILVYTQGCHVYNHLSLFLCISDYDQLLPGDNFYQYSCVLEYF